LSDRAPEELCLGEVCNRRRVATERNKNSPQRLKPARYRCIYGTSKLRPLQTSGFFRRLRRPALHDNEPAVNVRRFRSDAAGQKLKGLYGFGLDGVDLADGDSGDVEVFATCGRAGEAAEHGELADVSERVGDGALHEPLNGRLDGRG